MSQVDDVSYLENLLENNPDSVLFARLADKYVELGRFDDAIRVLRRGLERHANYSTAFILLAEAHWKNGDLDDAETAVSKGLELEPHNLRALKLRAEILRATGWIANAVQDYQTLLALDPLAEGIQRELENIRILEEEVVSPSELETDRATAEEAPGELEEQTETTETEPIDEEVEQVLDEIFESGTGETEVEGSPASPTQQTTVGESEELSGSIAGELIEEKSPEEELKEIFEAEKESGAAEEAATETATEESREEAKPSEPEKTAAGTEGSPKIQRPPIVTPTLGEIYAQQGQYAKAIGVFQVLKEKEPDNPEWDQKIEMLKRKLAEQEGKGQQ